MKILSARQIRELDAYTIEHTPIASIDLMERACRAFTGWFVEHVYGYERVGIVCGTGNNGGDGLGVARLLREQGYDVKVWIIRGNMPATEEFTTNLARAQQAGVKITDVSSTGSELLTTSDVVIDALFGSGLSRPPEGLYAWVIDEMNRARVRRIAIDIPSGLMADGPSSGPVVRADDTVSFQLPKLGFLLPRQGDAAGEWTLVDIGLSRDFIRNTESQFHYTREKSIRKLLHKRKRFDHKGTYGHALLIAGSLGKMGAAILCSRSALRTGLGLLTAHIPRCGNVMLQTAVPEAMVSLDRSEEIFTSPPSLEIYSAIGIGPGLGRSNETALALEFVLNHYRRPTVFDADALNILSERKELLKLLPQGSILTPHPKEFERLAGPSTDDFTRLDALRVLSAQTQCVIVLKGAYSAIAEPGGNIYFNSTGNPGMATGGTGDVLTGVIASLLAQQYPPLEAARIGVYLHGLAGDLAAMERGLEGLIASDIPEFIPPAFQRLHRK